MNFNQKGQQCTRECERLWRVNSSRPLCDHKLLQGGHGWHLHTTIT